MKSHAAKWVIVIPDGMYDEPQDALAGRTPLEAAETPHMDRVAREGRVGLIHTVPEGFSPGSDVAILAIVGCDVTQFYTGRAPIEAAAMGVDLAEGEWAFRMNLVTVTGEVLEDFSAGHIETADAHLLVEALQDAMGTDRYSFHPGVSYRHIMKRKGPAMEVEMLAPHDVMGRRLDDVLPKGRDAGELCELMARSRTVLDGHPVNDKRRVAGKKPGNMIWLWSGGPKPRLRTFRERFGLSGACISAVDLIKGMGALLGWDAISVEGATGYTDTNYAGKGRAACDALADHDLVFVHVEAPDEASHEGNLRAKMEAISRVDEQVLGPVMALASQRGDTRVAVLGDHYTPVRLRTHDAKPVPFAMWGPGIESNGARALTEKDAAASGLAIDPGYTFMERFLRA